MERLRSGDPEQIGPWQIVNRLGAGGMGIVYMGNNGTRAAAIKVVRDFLLEDPSSRARLAREVSSLKKVKSRFVAEIVDADVDSTPAWIATNYVDGPSLKTLIEHEGAMSEQKWFEFAYGLMSALNAVHKAGVIHRDIKPSNILMSATGPKIIDFGISFSSDATSLTRTGMVAGTPTWFAPEQFETNKVTNTVDNFAAGTVLFYAATGENPWGKEDTSVANTMHMILNKDADLSSLSAGQREVISLLLKKSPKERSTAEEILARLEHMNSALGNTESSSELVSSKKSINTKIAAASLVGVLALAGFSFLQLRPSASESPVATTSPSPSKEPVIRWRLKVVGNEKAQTGSGEKFSTYICDQGVIQESLKVRELSNPPTKSLPIATVVRGDARCGADFDTIEITGKIDNSQPRRNYVLAGSTSTGFLLQYEFNISIIN